MNSFNPVYNDISMAYMKICESSVNRIYAYHCTNTDPHVIAKEGFNANSDNADGFTESNQFGGLYEKYLPENPCFISDSPWDRDAKYVLKIDITGLELYPDFGHLLDTGAYFEEPDADGDVLFWWEGHDFGYIDSKYDGLRKYLDRTDGYLDSKDFGGKESWNMIGTACVDGDEITADRIVEINGHPVEDGNITEYCIRKPSAANESVYDDYNVDILNILEDFKDDKERGIPRKQWNLIDPEQYANALSKFVSEGPELFRFSERVVDGWIRLIVENIKEIEAIGVLDGREELNGGSAIDSYMVGEEFPDEFSSEYERLKPYAEKNGMGNAWLLSNAAYGALDSVGFYDWAVLPDGNPADSDNGIAGVREILEEIDEDASVSDKLVVINRCMDVFHQRSDLSSAFIKGGKDSLSRISARRTIAASQQMGESFSEDIHPKARENMIRDRRMESFCSGLSFDGERIEMDEGLLERILTPEVSREFSDKGCFSEGYSYENSKEIVFRMRALYKVYGKSMTKGQEESVRSKILYSVANGFKGILSPTIRFGCIGGSEYDGYFTVRDPYAVKRIKESIHTPSLL